MMLIFCFPLLLIYCCTEERLQQNTQHDLIWVKKEYSTKGPKGRVTYYYQGYLGQLESTRYPSSAQLGCWAAGILPSCSRAQAPPAPRLRAQH